MPSHAHEITENRPNFGPFQAIHGYTMPRIRVVTMPAQPPVETLPSITGSHPRQCSKHKRRSPEGIRLLNEVSDSLLPARLGDAGKLATVSHLTEANTADAVLREHATGAAVDDVA